MPAGPRTPLMSTGGRTAWPLTDRDGWRPGWSSSFALAEVPTGLMHVTDPDSRVVRTQGQPGMQGYNAQLAVNDRQSSVAAEITTESPDFGHLEPMVRPPAMISTADAEITGEPVFGQIKFQPRDQTLPTPRQNRVRQRMETDRRDPQPE